MNKFMTQLFLVSVVLALTWSSTLIHGRLTNRWSPAVAMQDHVSLFSSLPTDLPSWQLVTELPPLSDRVQKELGIHAHFNRVYENATGDRITALLMLGQTGALIRHPVEVCYGNRAKRMISRNQLVIQNESGVQKFKTTRYEPKSALEDQFYVAHAFCYEGKWDVPRSPRVEYGGKPLIYKLQVLTNAGRIPHDEVPSHVAEFIEELAPVVWPSTVTNAKSNERVTRPAME